MCTPRIEKEFFSHRSPTFDLRFLPGAPLRVHESMGQSVDRVTSSATEHAFRSAWRARSTSVAHAALAAADVHSSHALLPRGWGPADVTMNREQV